MLVWVCSCVYVREYVKFTLCTYIAYSGCLMFILKPTLKEKPCPTSLQQGDIIFFYVTSYNVKKIIVFPVPSQVVNNQTLPGQDLILIINYFRPGRVWLVTSRLGTGKTITFFTV
jgi:hypothetical protein